MSTEGCPLFLSLSNSLPFSLAFVLPLSLPLPLSLSACPLLSPSPSVPPATFVPFNVANDCRFFSLSLWHSSPGSALPLLALWSLCPPVLLPWTSPPISHNALLSIFLMTVNSVFPPKLGGGSDKMYIYSTCKKKGLKKEREKRKRQEGTPGSPIVPTDNSGS